MKDKKAPKALYDSGDTPLRIGEFEISCYVLDNGQRVLSRNGMLKALGLSYGTTGKKGADRLVGFVTGKRVSEFISNDLVALIETPINFLLTNEQPVQGYDAEVLQRIVRGVSKAYLTGKLQKQQEHIGQRAEILDDGFSKVGLVALVDEATGYVKAKNRAKDELQKYLEKLINDSAYRWVKTFDDGFFEMIFRMRGWSWNKTTKRPGVVGKYINDLVYSRIAPNVLEELRKKNPKDPKTGVRKKRHHQFLTRDFGHPVLREHLAGLKALGRASGYDWNIFNTLVNKSYPKFGHTIEINFPESLDQLSEGKKLSTFNKNLKKALEFNPKKKP